MTTARFAPDDPLRREDMFFFTQTLKPDFHILPIESQISLTYIPLLKVLRSFSRLRLVIEFTKAGVIHYHAVGVLHDPCKYWRTRNKLKEFGFYKFEKCKDPPSAHEYLMKDIDATLQKLPTAFKDFIIYDNLSKECCYKHLCQIANTYLKEKEYIEKKRVEALILPPDGVQMRFRRTNVGGKLIFHLNNQIF